MGPKVQILVQKLERVLFDLDFVYVNLLKILRDPLAVSKQKTAQTALKAKFNQIALSLSKQKSGAKAAQPVKKPSRPQSGVGGKQRPQTSKQGLSQQRKSGSVEEEFDFASDNRSSAIRKSGASKISEDQIGEEEFEDLIEDDEAKMEFSYDKLRKKHTVKPE